MKIALFDLDNTLNSTSKRKTLIPDDPSVNENWLPWHRAFTSERVNTKLVKTAIAYSKAGYQIGVVSNRDTSLVEETRKLLGHYGFPEARYHFREQKDNRSPSQWKQHTISHLLAFCKQAEVHHFDDDCIALNRLSEQFAYPDHVLYVPHFVMWE